MKKRVYYLSLLTIVFLMASIAYVWAFAKLHIVLGSGDLMFHANRMEEMYRDLQHGVFIPRISTYSFNQVGSGINFFYPWLLLYPFVLFRLITHNPISAFYLGIILETFATLSIAYYSMHKYSKSKKRAVIFSFLYTFATYRLYLVFNQNVLAESIGYIFIPLVLLGFYETFFRNKQQWPLLAIGMSLLLYSHMLTTALVALFLLITLIIFWRNVNGIVQRMWAAIKAVGLSVLLTAFYLFPFIEQTLGNHLRASWKGLLFIKQPSEVIQLSLDNSPSQVVGFLLILVLIFGFIYLRKSPIVEKYSYFAGLILTLLTTQLFPWGAFLHTPIANLQFPYRLNDLATVMLCVYLSFIIQNIVDNLKSHYKLPVGLSLLILFVLTFGLTLTGEKQIISQRINIPLLTARPTVKHYYPAENSASYNLSKETWHNMFYYYGHNGAFDYFPVTVKGQINTAVVTHYAYVGGKKIPFDNRLKSAPNRLTFELSGFKAGSIINLPVLYYKNDLIKVGNGKFKQPLISKVNTLQVRVPKNNKQAVVKYQDSILDTVSIILSIGTWLIVVIKYIKSVLVRGNKCETVSKTN